MLRLLGVHVVQRLRGGMQAISDSIALSGMLQPAGTGADGHYRLRP